VLYSPLIGLRYRGMGSSFILFLGIPEFLWIVEEGNLHGCYVLMQKDELKGVENKPLLGSRLVTLQFLTGGSHPYF